MLAIVQNAAPVERESALKLWASQTPGGYYGFVTTFELHHVLWHSDYCTNLLSWPGCKPLPSESEAQGIAKEMLDQCAGADGTARRDAHGDFDGGGVLRRPHLHRQRANFMIKAIAEDRGIAMPSFFGYSAYASLTFLPLLAIVALVVL